MAHAAIINGTVAQYNGTGSYYNGTEPFTMAQTLYTIGHSNQSMDEFLLMLQKMQIQALVDVRSVPASKYTPQFNKEPLQAVLRRHGITYLPFAEEFGARRTDAMDEDGKVDFEKAATTEAFLRGTQRVLNGLEKGYRITLMCSEAQPLECHRFALVSRWFYEHGVDVQHIVHNEEGEVVTIPHKTLQDEMVAEYVRKKKIPQVQPPDMFGETECTKEQQIVLAYRQKNKEIAYQQQTQDDIYL